MGVSLQRADGPLKLACHTWLAAGELEALARHSVRARRQHHGPFPRSRPFVRAPRAWVPRSALVRHRTPCSPHASKSVDPLPVVVRAWDASPDITSAPCILSFRAELCSGSQDTTPAACAALLPSCLAPDYTVAFCRGASSLTPSYCAAKLQTCSPSDSDVQHCRTAVSTATHLRVYNMSYDSVFLQPGSVISIRLAVLDQFDQVGSRTLSRVEGLCS